VSALRIDWLEAPEVAGEAAAALSGEVAWFERAERGESFLGLGAARVCETRDLLELSAALEAQTSSLDVFGAAQLGGAVWLGTAAFDPIRQRASGGGVGARFVLPRVTFLTRAGRSACAVAGACSGEEARRARDEALARLARPPLPGAEPGRFDLQSEEPPAAFRARVGTAVDAIARGDLQKVVLARAVRAEADAPIPVRRLLCALAVASPRTTRFLFARDGLAWLGATPEQLVRVDGERVEADAIAGTISGGPTPEADAVQVRALRESKKDQDEHAWVRDALRDILTPRVGGLEAPEAPAVRAAGAVHHLHTPFCGRRLEGSGLLQLAAALHPTPAVAGTPTPAALDWLRRHEPLVRGNYAGPVGWVGKDGSGDLAVALRCAQVQGTRVRAFAGAGVVAASDPDAELAETRLKLRAVLDPLLEI
jgi:isochorismate synthase